MPQFIKMGLGSTGYAGKQGASSRAARYNAARRVVLPGFPITTSFQSIDDVKDYLSGDRIICLLCGKAYKKLGMHLLKIHGITVDEYRKKYNIPWTYGILCAKSSKEYSKAMRKRMEDGYIPPLKFGEAHTALIEAPKRNCPFKAEIAAKNIKGHGHPGYPKHPLTVAPDGTLETFTQKRERLTAKRGTPEYKEKMSNRPQANGVWQENGKPWWAGKKQSAEHIVKRCKKRST